MFDIQLRVWKDRLTDPIASRLPSSLSPNLLTLISFLFGLASCVISVLGHARTIGVTFWIANRIFDCLDGSVARKRGQATELGGFLDLLGDFIIYSAIPIAIGLGGYERDNVKHEYISQLGMWIGVAALEASFHINNFVLFYVAAVASKRQAGELTSVTMQPALIEGFESGVLFTAMFIWPEHLYQMSWLMAGLVFGGTGQRVVQILVPALRKLDSKDRKLQ
ncbi:hypothetical protein MMC25_004138 [Agyrium rufum]|nr:hypothetical protein [Agyrium rufum]